MRASELVPAPGPLMVFAVINPKISLEKTHPSAINGERKTSGEKFYYACGSYPKSVQVIGLPAPRSNKSLILRITRGHAPQPHEGQRRHYATDKHAGRLSQEETV
jgi:hypothetical protein